MPSEKQYEFAWRIAHALRIELPQSFTKWAFSNFINENKKAFNELISNYKDDYEKAFFEQINEEAEKFSLAQENPN